MTLAVFSFESAQVRTLGTAESPLFVAIDIATALGYKNPKVAATQLVYPEDLIKQEIETKGGRQTVNCVNESGLYALIFGSKLESAKRFKRWVTNEVLPTIRKTGKYECPAAPLIPPAYLTLEHQYAIQSEVGKRAKGQGAHFQTIYRALKAHFKVPKYTYILDKNFDAAVEFIRTCELRVPATPEQAEPPKQEPKRYTVTEGFIERQRTFVYYWRYLFREELDRVIELMRLMKSPHASMLYEAVHNLNLALIETDLEKLGFPVSDMPCYKNWLGHQSA